MRLALALLVLGYGTKVASPHAQLAAGRPQPGAGPVSALMSVCS